MRQSALLFSALFLIGIACGPDPNATLPGEPPFVNGTGGSQEGPDVAPDLPAAGGAGGGVPSSGGTAGSGSPDAGKDVGSAWDTGSRDGGGGVGGKGGSGGSTVPAVPEPCTPAKEFSCASGNGNTGNFGTNTKFCFRTMDTFAGWGCPGFSPGWTLKVNGQQVECGADPKNLPPAVKGLRYFEAIGSATASQYASIYWYGTCKAPPFPAWTGTGVVLPGGSGGSGGGGASGAGGSTGGTGTTKDAATD